MVKSIDDLDNQRKSFFNVNILEIERSVRDVFFLIFLAGIIFGMGYLAVYSFKRGDPDRYLQGYDSWGNICGRKVNIKIPGVRLSGKDTSNEQFVMRLQLITLKLSNRRNHEKPPFICVSKCPTTPTTCEQLLKDNRYNITDDITLMRVCSRSQDIKEPHASFLQRCIPSKLLKVGGSVQEVVEDDLFAIESNLTQFDDQSSIARTMVTSLWRFYKEIILFSTIPIGLCFLTTVFYRFFSKFLIYAFIVVFSASSLGLTIYLWITYFSLEEVTQDDLQSIDTSTAPSVQNVEEIPLTETTYKQMNKLFSLFSNSRQNTTLYLIFTIVVSIATVGLLAVIAYFHKSIEDVVELYKEGSFAAFANACIFFQPVVTMLFVSLLLVYYFYVLAYLLSIRIVTIDYRGFVNYELDKRISYVGLFAGHTISFWYIWEFAVGCEQFVIAGAIASWYYEQKSEENDCNFQKCPSAEPTKNLIFYNLGTITIGALINMLVSLLRRGAEIIQSKKSSEKSEGGTITLPLNRTMIMCCLRCLEMLIRFFNRNAFICSAIYGTGFVKSSQMAFSLTIKNFRFAALLNIVSAILLFIGKCGVVFLTAFVAFFYFRQTLGADTPFTEYAFVVVVISIIAYIVADSFFNVYDIVLDTLFICYADDMERNSVENRRFFFSERLKKQINYTANQHDVKSNYDSDYRPSI